MALKWDEDTATALGRIYGYLPGESRATGGALINALNADTSDKAKEFRNIMSGIQGGSLTADALEEMLIDREIANQKADPSYGSLAKPSYKAFTPFADEAPKYESFKLSDFMEDPGYNFRKQEGQKAIDTASAARGGFYSGGALKEATEFGSNLAAEEFDRAFNRHVTDFQSKDANYTNRYNRYNTDFGIGYNQAQSDSDTLYNRLGGLINTGAGATNTAVGANQSNANAMGNIYGQVGNAQAANSLNQGNIWGNSLSSMLGRSSYSAPSQSGYGTYTSQGGLPWQQPGATYPIYR